MSLELTERTLADRRYGLGGWAIGLVAYVTLIVSLFPTVRDSAAFAQAMQDYPDVLKELIGGDESFDLTSGPGFLNAELFTLMLPLLLAVVAIGMAAALATERESGLVDLVLSTQVRRRRIVAERALAITIATLLLSAVVVIALSTASVFVDLDVALSDLLAVSTAVALLVLFHGFVALWWSAGVGNRSGAIGFTTALFAAGYVVSAFSGIVEWIAPLRWASPYHHALGPNPIVNGWAFGHLALLGTGCLGALVAAVITFDRRDLS